MDDVGRIVKAAYFAAEKHREQRRKDAAQTPYINHPLAVAETLRRLGMDDPLVLVSAVLHDVLEDTETSPGELAQAFGYEVLTIVQELTDDKSLPKETRKEKQIQQASQLSEDACLVRLADKICNLNDLIESPPADWSVARCLQYVDWCEAVVANMPKTHTGLESRFEHICEDARKAFQ